MAKSKQARSHHVRSTSAAICGAIGLLLIIASFFAVWINRTLTDTPTYVNTVAPLVHEPAIQEYVGAKTADSITQGIARKAPKGSLIQKFPAMQLAPLLVSPADLKGKTPAQINTLATDALKTNIQTLVASPDFATLWADTNRSAHKDFVDQIHSGAKEINLDLRPAITGLTMQLKATKLAPLGAAFKPKGNAGVLSIQGKRFAKVQSFYDLLTNSAYLLVALTLGFLGLSVLFSVHHKHTLYRVILGTGIVSLITSLLLWSTTFWKMGGGPQLDQRAAAAVAKVLFHNLQLASLGIGVVFIGSTLGFRLYKKHLRK